MVGRRVLVAAFAAGLVASLVAVPAGAGPARPGPVRQVWTEIFHQLDEPVAVATARRTSAVTLTGLDRTAGLRVSRVDARGHAIWTHVWRGPGGSVGRVVGRDVAVSAYHRSVFVAGQAVCRHQGDAVYLGPVFVRRYRLDGAREWTRWIGDCPSSAADRHIRSLDLTGVAANHDGVAVTFTQGKSFDCCPHHRRGHVVVFGTNGTLTWRKTLNFPGPRQSEVVTADVTTSGRALVMSGTVVRRGSGSDAFLLGLSREDGSALWRAVVQGQSEPNVDEYKALDSAAHSVFAVGLRDDTFEGGGGQAFLERWTPDGVRQWRAQIPSAYASVAALNDGSVLWSASIWRRDQRDQLAFGRQTHGGGVAWRDRWTFPRGSTTFDYDFAAMKHTGFSLALVSHHQPPREYVQLWRWRW